MTGHWRIAVLILAALCGVLAWMQFGPRRAASSSDPTATGVADPPSTVIERRPAPRDLPRAADVTGTLTRVLPHDGATPADDAPGIDPATLLAFFLPEPGEDSAAYRTRIYPVVRDVLAPQRDRVGRLRDEFARAAQLTDEQKQKLDASVGQAGEAIEDRVMQGLMSGELSPNMKPSVGVAFARDVLEDADRANREFRASLTPAQQAALDADRFDVSEYLLFTTHWEDLLGVTSN